MVFGDPRVDKDLYTTYIEDNTVSTNEGENLAGGTQTQHILPA